MIPGTLATHYYRVYVQKTCQALDRGCRAGCRDLECGCRAAAGSRFGPQNVLKVCHWVLVVGLDLILECTLSPGLAGVTVALA